MVYVGKDSVEKFVSFLTKLIGLLKREQKAVENVMSILKSLLMLSCKAIMTLRIDR